MTDIKSMNHLENTKLALKYWLTVPPQNVAPGLGSWNRNPGKHTCGTIACFGGWVPAMPEFAAMGVTAGIRGEPEMAGMLLASDVAKTLFGEVDHAWGNGFRGNLFDTAGYCAYDRDPDLDVDQSYYTDSHGLVVHRLESHIKYLESRT